MRKQIIVMGLIMTWSLFAVNADTEELILLDAKVIKTDMRTRSFEGLSAKEQRQVDFVDEKAELLLLTLEDKEMYYSYPVEDVFLMYRMLTKLDISFIDSLTTYSFFTQDHKDCVDILYPGSNSREEMDGLVTCYSLTINQFNCINDFQYVQSLRVTYEKTSGSLLLRLFCTRHGENAEKDVSLIELDLKAEMSLSRQRLDGRLRREAKQRYVDLVNEYTGLQLACGRRLVEKKRTDGKGLLFGIRLCKEYKVHNYSGLALDFAIDSAIGLIK